jgi:hypothetical protein
MYKCCEHCDIEGCGLVRMDDHRDPCDVMGCDEGNTEAGE